MRVAMKETDKRNLEERMSTVMDVCASGENVIVDVSFYTSGKCSVIAACYYRFS